MIRWNTNEARDAVGEDGGSIELSMNFENYTKIHLLLRFYHIAYYYYYIIFMFRKFCFFVIDSKVKIRNECNV